MSTPLTLNDIVNVSVTVSPSSSVRPSFDLGLIVGNSVVINTTDRVKVYSDLAGMIADGFTSTMAEYQAAQLYFSQTPRPKKVAIGRWDATGSETAVQALTACRQKNTDWYACTVCGLAKANILLVAAYIETAILDSAYFYTTADSDIPTGTAGNIQLLLKALGYKKTHGQYSTYNDMTTGYETGAASPSTDISGGSLTTFKIAADGDSSPKSIVLTVTGLNTGALIAAAMQTAIRLQTGAYSAVTVTFTNGVYVISSGTQGTSSKIRITAGASNDVSAALKLGATNGAVATDGTGDYFDSVAAIMGYAMGANTGLANSTYTLAYKREIGVLPEDLTETQITAIKAQNGNVYVNRGMTYNVYEPGKQADGTHFDEVINLDILKNQIQLSVMDLLTGISKVPQTESGITLIVNAITGPCDEAVRKGFIAPGIWKGAPLLTLETGDTLSKGYLILSDSLANQTQSDRDARMAPAIYVPVKLAGAVEHVVISITVNR